MKKWNVKLLYKANISVNNIIAETQNEAIEKARERIEDKTVVYYYHRPIDSSVDTGRLEYEQSYCFED